VSLCRSDSLLAVASDETEVRMVDEKAAPPGSGAPNVENRRGFLKVLGIGGLGAGAAGTALVPALRATTYPLQNETTSESVAFVPVGKAERFKDGAPPLKVDVVADQQDAWNRVEQVKIGAAWVARKAGKLTAYSSVCPHLGCGVDYVADKHKYYCACHRSWFAEDGAVETGPCLRALDTLEVQEQDGKVAVQYQKFKLGIAAKEKA